MQESLIPLLRCPVTRTGLTAKGIKWTTKKLDGESIRVIDEALLYAEKDWVYPVIQGIPRLNIEAFLDHEKFFETAAVDYLAIKLNLLKNYSGLIKEVVKKNKRTKESFTKEWSVFNYDTDNTWGADDDAMVTRFLNETDETAGSLKHKIIFDAGCGHGKLDLLIAPDCKAVIGMDFANCIEEAYAKNEFGHVHFIQGDVEFPPVLFRFFDIVHCSGVLIHTKNAEYSFTCIEPTVKEKGKLSVWLYHPRKDLIHNLFNWVRSVTSKLPLTVQYYLYLYTIFPVSFCVKRIKGNKQNRREMMVNILDWFSPEFRSEHEHKEVATWFLKNGYTKHKLTTSDNFGFNMIGEKN